MLNPNLASEISFDSISNNFQGETVIRNGILASVNLIIAILLESRILDPYKLRRILLAQVLHVALNLL